MVWRVKSSRAAIFMELPVGCRLQDADTADAGCTLRQIGADSLMAVELRRWWKLTFGVDVTTLEMMGGGSLRDPAVTTVQKIKEMLAAA